MDDSLQGDAVADPQVGICALRGRSERRRCNSRRFWRRTALLASVLCWVSARVILQGSLAQLWVGAHNAGRQTLQRRLTLHLRASADPSASATEDAVNRLVVPTVIRTTPHASEAKTRRPLQVLVLGEANICRSVLAEVLLRQQLEESGLSEDIGCESKAVKDFCVGEAVPANVRAACEAAGVAEIPDTFAGRLWRPEWDVCDFDLLVAVDRYVAADAMKEVSVWDTIQKEVEYCTKIRGLCEFGGAVESISDPLYGNVGGEQELAAVKQTIAELKPAVRGLTSFLADCVKEAKTADGTDRRRKLARALDAGLERKGAMDWNAPPMLTRRTPSPAGVSNGLFDIEG
eukprot:TRINITY_DN19379_c0_g1_i3.p1 TRINITY_DN19379_c0_g1~~TRINITY_DN19379_c0_g1_i3.p1  ORF type:complete len:346 (-),score=58.31 TRINITY_DN19379_c0_g1_i3:171-1208(-)